MRYRCAGSATIRPPGRTKRTDPVHRIRDSSGRYVGGFC
ncbi:Hypothetical protein I596_3294 [Dokdonella koreensis DS-123]|uniref:Uncharacterized protein n=1 Tax=Dokdonella koreensis DS-123 TaxID=1300342 RepID=A0A160DYS9_9GAMM|nr:Hypothetical protein I596_3294 [Dokdonella koreensis DS-123]